MNSIRIKPSKLKGKVLIPPSKSLSHRAIISASLCNENSVINNLIYSDDIKTTIEGMRSLGAEIGLSENKAYIKRNNLIKQNPLINCMESGSSLRFLIPVALTLTSSLKFTGSKKLFERPLSVYYDIFKKQNINYKISENLLYINGNLSSGNFEIPGNVSSQFISGLLLSLPLLEGDSEISIIGNLESNAYVDLTIEVLNKFGINIERNDKIFYIRGKQSYKSCEYSVEGDYSQAAFFLVANELGNEIECLGLNISSKQGDKEIINIINMFKDSNDIIIDASQIPDLVPIITVLAALKENHTTTIINAHRLRIKESDRLKAVTTEMNKLGACVRETNDGLIINGKASLIGGTSVNSWNDHRIAMSLAIAATRCKNDIILEDHFAINKSYPHFWNDYKSIGGAAIELNNRQ
jgi:3-phosphoshikimate 1-carboxyvinyltransferase